MLKREKQNLSCTVPPPPLLSPVLSSARPFQFTHARGDINKSSYYCHYCHHHFYHMLPYFGRKTKKKTEKNTISERIKSAHLLYDFLQQLQISYLAHHF